MLNKNWWNKSNWYKVVSIKDEGSCAWCFTDNDMKKGSYFIKEIKRIYKNGNIVKADLDTMGLFIFKYRKDAEDFIKDDIKWKIKKVRPIDNPVKIQDSVIPGCNWIHLILREQYIDGIRHKTFSIIKNPVQRQETPKNTYTCKELLVMSYL